MSSDKKIVTITRRTGAGKARSGGTREMCARSGLALGARKGDASHLH